MTKCRQPSYWQARTQPGETLSYSCPSFHARGSADLPGWTGEAPFLWDTPLKPLLWKWKHSHFGRWPVLTYTRYLNREHLWVPCSVIWWENKLDCGKAVGFRMTRARSFCFSLVWLVCLLPIVCLEPQNWELWNVPKVTLQRIAGQAEWGRRARPCCRGVWWHGREAWKPRVGAWGLRKAPLHFLHPNVLKDCFKWSALQTWRRSLVIKTQ